MNKKLRKRTSPIWKPSKEEFQEIVNQCSSISKILEHFGLRHAGGNANTLRKRFKEDNIDLSLFDKHQRQRAAVRAKNISIKYKLEDVLINGSNYNRSQLKRRLIQERLIQEVCAECGIGNQWNNKQLVLHLDHINGVHNDNRLENLRLLCPNCHSQTDNYSGRSNKTELDVTRSICPNCGKYKHIKSKLCVRCNNKRNTKKEAKVTNRPKDDELIELVKQHGNVGVGKMYNVSEAAVRKWLKKDRLNKEDNNG